jgi:hypothetical protein
MRFVVAIVDVHLTMVLGRCIAGRRIQLHGPSDQVRTITILSYRD